MKTNTCVRNLDVVNHSQSQKLFVYTFGFIVKRYIFHVIHRAFEYDLTECSYRSGNIDVRGLDIEQC